MNLAREWVAFAGALFTLMGVSLAAVARRNAEDALSWQRQWRDAVGAPEPARDDGPSRRRLTFAYRAGGVVFAAAGLILLFAAATGRATFPVRNGRLESLAGGVIFTACGLILIVNAWLRVGRSPRFLDGELLDFEASPPFAERVADACSRGIIALFLVFGLRLLIEALR